MYAIMQGFGPGSGIQKGVNQITPVHGSDEAMVDSDLDSHMR